MREIKYRAWDEEKKEMFVCGDDMDVIFNLSTDGIECVDVRKVRPSGDNVIDKYDLYYLQYTGLKDKNGVEIYEGDVVSWRDEDAIYSVNCGEFGVPNVETESYQDLAIGFFMKPEHSWKEIIPFSLTLPLNSIYVKEIKVVGNIYENKNLLEE